MPKLLRYNTIACLLDTFSQAILLKLSEFSTIHSQHIIMLFLTIIDVIIIITIINITKIICYQHHSFLLNS